MKLLLLLGSCKYTPSLAKWFFLAREIRVDWEVEHIMAIFL